MRFLLALAMLSLALFVGSAAVAEGNVPGFGTEDSCAAVFTEDASACGGSYPVLIGNAYGQCTWDYGPYSSPRIRQAPC